MTTVYIPKDSAALAVGADAVAATLAAECKTRGLNVTIVRNSSRGLLWLETLLEVATADGRVAYGPVEASDIASLLDAGMLEGKSRLDRCYALPCQATALDLCPHGRD
jgi:formate dehydrogenase iron-sulfur subunit